MVFVFNKIPLITLMVSAPGTSIHCRWLEKFWQK